MQVHYRAGNFWGIYTLFYTIKFRGLCKSGGARAPAAPPSSAPMYMSVIIVMYVVSRVIFITLCILRAGDHLQLTTKLGHRECFGTSK